MASCILYAPSTMHPFCAHVGTGQCYEAYTPNHSSCSGYTSAGYTCVGYQCAAINPGGEPRECAQLMPDGTVVNSATGKCERPQSLASVTTASYNWQTTELPVQYLHASPQFQLHLAKGRAPIQVFVEARNAFGVSSRQCVTVSNLASAPGQVRSLAIQNFTDVSIRAEWTGPHDQGGSDLAVVSWEMKISTAEDFEVFRFENVGNQSFWAPVNASSKLDSRVMKAELPAVAAHQSGNWTSLFVGQNRAIWARWPNGDPSADSGLCLRRAAGQIDPNTGNLTRGSHASAHQWDATLPSYRPNCTDPERSMPNAAGRMGWATAGSGPFK